MSKPKPQPSAGQDQEQPAENVSSDDSTDYEVGYKKPPKHSQFQKGNSYGKGRKKGSKGMKTMVNEAFGMKVPANMGGKKKKFAKIEVSLHRLINKAMQGDDKAAGKAIPLYERYGPQDEADGPPPAKVAKDLDSLEKFLAIRKMIEGDSEEPDHGGT